MVGNQKSVVKRRMLSGVVGSLYSYIVGERAGVRTRSRGATGQSKQHADPAWPCNSVQLSSTQLNSAAGLAVRPSSIRVRCKAIHGICCRVLPATTLAAGAPRPRQISMALGRLAILLPRDAAFGARRSGSWGIL